MVTMLAERFDLRSQQPHEEGRFVKVCDSVDDFDERRSRDRTRSLLSLSALNRKIIWCRTDQRRSNLRQLHKNARRIFRMEKCLHPFGVVGLTPIGSNPAATAFCTATSRLGTLKVR